MATDCPSDSDSALSNQEGESAGGPALPAASSDEETETQWVQLSKTPSHGQNPPTEFPLQALPWH